MSTGAIPDDLMSDLEALKKQLTSMTPGDLPAPEARAMASEISAIRLQLKRLEADRAWVHDRIIPPLSE